MSGGQVSDRVGSTGDDPYLNMPSIEVLAVALAKRKAPIKAVLLDQNKVSSHSRHRFTWIILTHEFSLYVDWGTGW